MTEKEQQLIITAYKEEIEKWNKDCDELKAKITSLNTELSSLDQDYASAQVDQVNQNGASKLWYKTTGRHNPVDMRMAELDLLLESKTKEMYDLVIKYQNKLNNKPNDVLYDIALYDGKLFKAW